MATSGFQDVTRGWVSNACLFNSRSLLSQAKDSSSKENFGCRQGEWPMSSGEEMGLRQGCPRRMWEGGQLRASYKGERERSEVSGHRILLHIFSRKKKRKSPNCPTT